MARVIFVNRFYWPDEPATSQLLTDLAEGLVARGHDVSVIASHSRQATVPAPKQRHGVTILSVRSTRSRRGGLAMKTLDWLTFFLGSLWVIARRSDRTTTVVAMTDPPLLAVGAWLVTRMRGARLVHWVQDIYPEIAIELTGHRWLRMFRPVRDAAWCDAAHCVTLGSDMAQVLAAAGVKRENLSVIPNWAPAGLQPASPVASEDRRASWGLIGRFVVAYSGNFGRVHHLEAVLEVATALRSEPDIAFVLIGHGAQHDHLVRETKRRALTNVTFHPPQPRARLAETLALGDVHLVTLRPGCERFVFPSKLPGVAAMARPVIFIGPADCEIARHVVTYKLGYAVTPDAIPALAAMVRRLAQSPDERNGLAKNGAVYAGERSVRAAVEQWDALLTRIAGSPRADASAKQTATR